MVGRIGGIQKANWSRSQLAIGAAGSGLRLLAAAGVDMLAIKGAARAAGGGVGARTRVVNDIDIVVRPDDMERAFDLLTADGWLPAGSGSSVYHRSRLEHAVGINLLRGRFGNLDLHRTAFHPPYTSSGDGEGFWERSMPGKLSYTELRVPGAADSIAVALAHGALDAHKSSDWLADIVAGIDSGVDWGVFEEVAARHRLAVPAAASLRYIHERLERPVPKPLLSRLEAWAARRPFTTLAAVAEIRPKSRGKGMFWLMRAVAKQSRLWRNRRHDGFILRRRVILASPFGYRGARDPGTRSLEEALILPDRKPGEAWRGVVDLVLSLDLPPLSRRLEFEVNCGKHHLLRLRALAYGRWKREGQFRFKFPLAVEMQDGDPVLSAVAGRRFNDDAEPISVARYNAIPFAISFLDIRKLER